MISPAWTETVGVSNRSTPGDLPPKVSQSQDIATAVDRVRVQGTNEAGEVIWGPILQDKSQGLTFQGVPTAVTRVIIELRSGDLTVGGTSVLVTVPPGSTVQITNPTYVYAGLTQPPARASASATHTVQLQPGWNPVAFEGTHVTQVTAPNLASCLLASYDGTTYHSTTVSTSTINEGAGTFRGFFIFTTQAQTLTYDSDQSTRPFQLDLKTGYNLVSFPQPAFVPGGALASFVNGQAVALIGAVLPVFTRVVQNGSSSANVPIDMGQAGSSVTPGSPYWVNARQNCQLRWTDPGSTGPTVAAPTEYAYASKATAQALPHVAPVSVLFENTTVVGITTRRFLTGTLFNLVSGGTYLVTGCVNTDGGTYSIVAAGERSPSVSLNTFNGGAGPAAAPATQAVFAGMEPGTPLSVDKTSIQSQVVGVSGTILQIVRLGP